MNTYQNQLRADEEKVDAETPLVSESNMIERAGRYSALARYYANSADFEAAKYQAVVNDPLRAVAMMTANGITPAMLADCLYMLANSLPSSDEYDWQSTISAIEDAADAAFEEASAVQRRADDLDAPAAARSDEEYDRKVDDALIGRSTFNKVPV